MNKKIMNSSTYICKNGLQMKKITLALPEEVANKLNEISRGFSKSTIISQMILENYRNNNKSKTFDNKGFVKIKDE